MKYTIPKGGHYSQPRRFGLHWGAVKQKYTVRFTESCLYPVTDGYHQWNKGTGWTYGLFNDINSIRWAWRPKPGNPLVLELGIYLHVNGITIEPEHTIELPEAFPLEDFTVILTNDISQGIVWLDVHGEHLSQTVDCKAVLKPAIGWRNHVYYGGRNTAPHQIAIDVT